MISLTNQQREAIVKACAWYFDTTYSKKNHFIISGYAGTGKSTIVNTLIDVLGLASYNVLFAAFTGKAALILRMKGNQANTIHKSFYNIFYMDNGAYRFNLKRSLPSTIKLIVIDECSMINDAMIKDILSFNLPVIFLGDIGQLPPVIGTNSLLKDTVNIDVQLTQVLRQDDTSGILQLATMYRNGERPKIGKYKKCNVLYLKDVEDITKYDIVLCWRNNTRKLFNQAIRRALKIESVFPLKGEKVIGLKNNYYHQIEYAGIPIFPVNGLPSIVQDDYKTTKNKHHILLKYKPDFIKDAKGPSFKTLCHNDYFEIYYGNIDREVHIKDDEDEIAHLDFGYALSVHRSQGSEYKRGLLLDEFEGNYDIHSKFLYTGVTRFMDSVDIVIDYKK
ncbi:MAG: ATP-dependent DNA helicase [Anaeroplasmataceae bacterium]